MFCFQSSRINENGGKVTWTFVFVSLLSAIMKLICIVTDNHCKTKTVEKVSMTARFFRKRGRLNEELIS